VHWKPGAVVEKMVPGQSRVVIVKFVASTDINDFTVHVTPNIEQFVSIGWSDENLVAGKKYSLELRIDIPDSAPPGRIRGAVYLQKEEKLKKALRVKIRIKWNRIKSKQDGYVLRYPDSYAVERIGSKLRISDVLTTTEGDAPAKIEVLALPINVSSALNLIRPLFTLPDMVEETVFVDGVAGTRISGTLSNDAFGWDSVTHSYVVIPRRDGTVIEFDYDSSDPEVDAIVNEMLNSLELR